MLHEESSQPNNFYNSLYVCFTLGLKYWLDLWIWVTVCLKELTLFPLQGRLRLGLAMGHAGLGQQGCIFIMAFKARQGISQVLSGQPISNCKAFWWRQQLFPRKKGHQRLPSHSSSIFQARTSLGASCYRKYLSKKWSLWDLSFWVVDGNKNLLWCLDLRPGSGVIPFTYICLSIHSIHWFLKCWLLYRCLLFPRCPEI